jgi:hypothetical protein
VFDECGGLFGGYHRHPQEQRTLVVLHPAEEDVLAA